MDVLSELKFSLEIYKLKESAEQNEMQLKNTIIKKDISFLLCKFNLLIEQKHNVYYKKKNETEIETKKDAISGTKLELREFKNHILNEMDNLGSKPIKEEENLNHIIYLSEKPKKSKNKSHVFKQRIVKLKNKIKTMKASNKSTIKKIKLKDKTINELKDKHNKSQKILTEIKLKELKIKNEQADYEPKNKIIIESLILLKDISDKINNKHFNLIKKLVHNYQVLQKRNEMLIEFDKLKTYMNKCMHNKLTTMYHEENNIKSLLDRKHKNTKKFSSYQQLESDFERFALQGECESHLKKFNNIIVTRLDKYIYKFDKQMKTEVNKLEKFEYKFNLLQQKNIAKDQLFEILKFENKLLQNSFNKQLKNDVYDKNEKKLIVLKKKANFETKKLKTIVLNYKLLALEKVTDEIEKLSANSCVVLDIEFKEKVKRSMMKLEKYDNPEIIKIVTNLGIALKYVDESIKLKELLYVVENIHKNR